MNPEPLHAPDGNPDTASTPDHELSDEERIVKLEKENRMLRGALDDILSIPCWSNGTESGYDVGGQEHKLVSDICYSALYNKPEPYIPFLDRTLEQRVGSAEPRRRKQKRWE